MKKFFLCVLLLGLLSVSPVVNASQMNSEVGIEFSANIIEDKKEPNNIQKVLPKTGETQENKVNYSILGLIVLGSVLFLKGEILRRRGER